MLACYWAAGCRPTGLLGRLQPWTPLQLVHCTLHTAHGTLDYAHCPTYTAHFTLHTAHCTGGWGQMRRPRASGRRYCMWASLTHRCNTAKLQQISTATLEHCKTATHQHCKTVTLQHCNTVTLQDCNTGTVQDV